MRGQDRLDQIRWRTGVTVGGLFCLFGTVSCTVPIANGLDDGSATQVAVALQRAGTQSIKEPDPDHEGKWALSVPKSDVARALEVLVSEGLPKPQRPGLSEVSESNALVPSLQLEQTRVLARVSNDLERSLAAIEGIVSANVHLALTQWNPLSQTEQLVPSASVLIRYRGQSSPIAVQAVQQLVSGAVMTPPDNVHVVALACPARPNQASNVVHFGPFAVLRGTERTLRLAVGICIFLNLSTLSLLIHYWLKAKRSQAD